MAILAAKEKTNERAYYIWEAQGRPHGRALDHWLQAEAELTAKPKRKPAKKATAAKTEPGAAVVQTATKKAKATAKAKTKVAKKKTKAASASSKAKKKKKT